MNHKHSATGRRQLRPLALLLALGVSLPAAAANQFVKLDAQGQAMARSAEAACVLDDASGLVWEAKRNDSSLRDVNNTYSWLPLSDNNKGRYDEADGGSCTGDIKCDTASYVRAVNDDKLCGFSDWRVPTRDELNGIRVSQSELPKIDIDFFPHTWESVYWASSGRDEQARSVDFGDSFDYINRHSRVKYLRLVRGGK